MGAMAGDTERRGLSIPAKQSRLGVVGLPAADEPALSDSLTGEVTWRSTVHDLTAAATGVPVDTIVFNIDVADREGLFEAIDQARSLKPSVKSVVAAPFTEGLVVAEIVSLVHHDAYLGAPAPNLTAREGQVVRKIRTGQTNREIAGSLRISRSTVNRHVENILKKLSARDRARGVAETPVSGREPWAGPTYFGISRSSDRH